jgi:hypothetical protein
MPLSTGGEAHLDRGGNIAVFVRQAVEPQITVGFSGPLLDREADMVLCLCRSTRRKIIKKYI